MILWIYLVFFTSLSHHVATGRSAAPGHRRENAIPFASFNSILSRYVDSHDPLEHPLMRFAEGSSSPGSDI